MSTVGCARACADQLLATASIEIYEVAATAGINWASDTVNPVPQAWSPGRELLGEQ